MPTTLPDTFTADERRAAFSLASIFALRMLGLFIVLPVFSLYAQHLAGATPFLIGLAAGVYGLTQGLLQMPLGFLSDYYSRKHIIAAGLLLFAIGSLIAANTSNIMGMLLGRTLQGAGAVGGATIALLADLTRETQRTKAMAIVGMSIGLSFYLAMLLSTVITAWIGIPALFILTAVFALLALFILFRTVPTPHASTTEKRSPLCALNQVFRHTDLLLLNFGIFVLHLLLTALFVALPIALQSRFGLNSHQQLLIYLPAICIAALLATPGILYAEKKRLTNVLFITSILLLFLTQISLYCLPFSRHLLFINLIVFFTAFTFLEAVLPATVSKIAPSAYKGAAMGLYSSTQFFGIFVGGVLGGWFYHHYSLESVFGAGACCCAVWLALTLKKPLPHRPIISSEQPSF